MSGRKHGPYYLRYEVWDPQAGTIRYFREYVPRTELARVRQWVRRHRAATTSFGWGQAGVFRRIEASLLRSRRKGFGTRPKRDP